MSNRLGARGKFTARALVMRDRVEEAEATTYSTETGEKAAAADETARRKPKRRRVPRPEAIAQIHKPGDSDED